MRAAPACAAELAEQQEFQTQMNALPVEEPSASFLAASRMRLQEALEHGAAASRLVSPAGLRSHGMAAAGALLARAGFGDFPGGLRRRPGRDVQDDASTSPLPPCRQQLQEASIGGITSIERDPATNKSRCSTTGSCRSRCRARSTIPRCRTCCLRRQEQREFRRAAEFGGCAERASPTIPGCARR